MNDITNVPDNASLIINDVRSIIGPFSEGPPCDPCSTNFPVCVLWAQTGKLRYNMLLSNSRSPIRSGWAQSLYAIPINLCALTKWGQCFLL